MDINNIILVVIVSILLISFILINIQFYILSIDLYFMKFKMGKHPVLIKLVDDLLKSICYDEKITVFNKSFDELNKDVKDDNEKVVGTYVYCSSVSSHYNKIYPRIYLCDDYLMKLGIDHYHNTFFHEIGHHFAIKKIGREHDEEDANKIARQIILDKLPSLFQLIPNYSFEYIIDNVELSFRKKIIAYLDYLKYYKKHELFTIKKS